jgi:hypothetical protein
MLRPGMFLLQEKTPAENDSENKPFSLSPLQRNIAFGLFIVDGSQLSLLFSHM